MGFNILSLPDERKPVPFEVNSIDAVICNGLFLYTPIEGFKNLKYIQLTSAGMDRLPVDYVEEKNIILHNANGVYGIPMAEFAIGGILQLYKKSSFFYENKKNKQWIKNRELSELYGKTACIIGAGNIGSELAKRLGAFGVKNIGIDLYSFDSCYFECIKPIDEMHKCLREADIVVLTCPLSDKTLRFFGKTEFDLMKNNSVFVNISRGKLVDEGALIDALTNRGLYAAVLDVFDKEPLSQTNPLWKMDNVILTPHNSFVGENNNKRLFDVIKANLAAWIR